MDSKDRIPRCLQNAKECLEPINISIKGTLPSWLQGTLLSSGPGLFDLEEESVGHWLDGYAITSKFHIEGNSLTYRSRYVNSTAYQKAIKEGHPVAPEWGTPPGKDNSRGYFASLMLAFTPFDVSDNSVGRILKIGPKYYSVAYSCYFHEIDPDTLETIGTLDSWNSFGANSFTPEYVRDKDGNIYLMGSVLKPTLSYMPLHLPREIAESAEPELSGFKVLGTIPPRWSFGGCGMRTCFAITENYFIFIEAPWVISLIKFAATFIQGYSMKNWLDFYPDEGTRICIVDKKNGRVIQTEIYARAFIVSSIINAYEDNNEIVLDTFVIPSPKSAEAMELDRLRKSYVSEEYEGGKFFRYRIPVVEDISCHEEGQSLLQNTHHSSNASAYRDGEKIVVNPQLLLDKENGCDYGIINPNFVGEKHSYIYYMSSYASSLSGQCRSSNGIVKLQVTQEEDSVSKDSTLVWEGRIGHLPSPPVFVPRPGSTQEDDGIIITCTGSQSDMEGESDGLVFIDAKTMTELARADIPWDLPLWYHASYYPSGL